MLILAGTRMDACMTIMTIMTAIDAIDSMKADAGVSACPGLKVEA